MTTLPLSPMYRVAVRAALRLQVPLALLMMLLLDGGVIARIGGCVMIGFWLTVAVMMLRRPWMPTRLDLAFIRWGYLPLLLAGVYIAGLIQNYRG